MSILETFDRSLARVSHTAASSYLRLLRPDIEFVESQAHGSPELQARIVKLSQMLLQPHFALEATAINTFSQDLAEAQFLAICISCEVPVEPVQRAKGMATPDFRAVEDETTTFEVKALSVVGGDCGISKNLEESLSAKIDMEHQIGNGVDFALVEQEVAPYGEKVISSRMNLDLTNVLWSKTEQNIKSDQFNAQRSFLVLNTTFLPVLSPGAEGLRPVYWDNHTSPHPVSGEMWMLAFGRSGMAVFGHPEFEGRPGLEGYFEKEGILREHSYIAGIYTVRREIDGSLNLGFLARASDLHVWFHEECRPNFIQPIVKKHWNDDLDSNGWFLSSKE